MHRHTPTGHLSEHHPAATLFLIIYRQDMAGIIDLSFDNDEPVSSSSISENNTIISLLDDSQDTSDGAANATIVNTGSLSRREARKRRRLAIEKSLGQGATKSLSSSTTTTTASISPKKKETIKLANAKVEEISKRIKSLRNELVKAEKELSRAVGKKIKVNTNDTLGDDGSMSIENTNILEELKETLSCSICLDSYSQKNNIWTTGCGHLYHKRCINQCINAGHRKCPLCKKPINKAKLHPIWI
jgi:hypothetical protein